MRPLFIASAALLIATTFAQAAQAAQAAELEVPACDSPIAQSLAKRAFGAALAKDAASSDKKTRDFAKNFFEEFRSGGIFELVAQRTGGDYLPGTEVGSFRVCAYNAVPPSSLKATPMRFVALVFVSRKNGELVAQVEIGEPVNYN